MRIVKVSSMEELQVAVNKAKDGDVICVPSNMTFIGNLVLPARRDGGQVAIVGTIGK